MFNCSSFPPYDCQIHIDIPRMSPESLVLQPKVTEVRATEWTKLENDSSAPTVSGTIDTHGHAIYHMLSEPYHRPFLDCFSWPLSCNRLSYCPKPHLFLSICLPISLLVRGADKSEMVRSWSGAHNIRKRSTRPPAKPISESSTSAPLTPRLHLPPNQRSQSTNCSVPLSVHAFVCIGLDKFSNLPVCFSVFFSLSLLLSLQIHIDIPRTNPLIPLFQQASVQEVSFYPNHSPQSLHMHACTHIHLLI